MFRPKWRCPINSRHLCRFVAPAMESTWITLLFKYSSFLLGPYENNSVLVPGGYMQSSSKGGDLLVPAKEEGVLGRRIHLAELQGREETLS